MIMKKSCGLLMVFLLVLSPFSLAVDSVSEEVDDCNWWCKTNLSVRGM